jgi:hypothetical protein
MSITFLQVVAVEVMLDRLRERPGVDQAEVAGVACGLRTEPLVCEPAPCAGWLAIGTWVDYDARHCHPMEFSSQTRLDIRWSGLLGGVPHEYQRAA